MLGGKRSERIAELVKDEISQLIQNRVKDPRVGFVTVTHVEMSPDLRYARIHYSVLGDSRNQEETQLALERACGFLQRELASQLRLRFTPKLNFRFDSSLEATMRIEKILKNLQEE